MVNPSYFAPPDTTSRRFANHRTPYPQPLGPDSRKTSSIKHSYSFETPGGNMSSCGYDENGSHQRKRIPVACGRCRKRKIRCSGDTGTGEPCANCRNAGVSPCQFLRVSSQETPFKQDNGFNYNLTDSRAHHARGPTSLASTQPPLMPPPLYHEGVPLNSMDTFQPYRNSGAYTYGTPTVGRAYISCGTPGYCDPSQEEQTDGGYHHQPMYSTGYAPQLESRYLPSYQPTPTASKSLAPYVDAESAAYGYGAHSTSIPTATTLTHRPALGVEAAGSVWYHNIAAGMSSSSGSNKHPYSRNDSISSATVYSKSSSSPASSLPDVASTSSCGSGSYESSPVSSYPPGFPPMQQLPPISRPGDMYPGATSTTTSATATSSNSDFPPLPKTSYVYADASAAVEVAIRRGLTVSPGNGSHRYTTSSYGVPDGLKDVDRKPVTALRS